MQIQLEVPDFPVCLGWESPLSDEQFERLSQSNDLFQLERSKRGDLIVNAPAGGLTGNGNTEILHQLQAWWKTHRLGRVFDCNTGFFLADGSMLVPDAAYLTAAQLKGVHKKDLARLPRLCPAFVIELLSRTDRRKAAEAKMQDWIANGAQLAWLIDPYKKSVTIYESGTRPRTTRAKLVPGTGPIASFAFNAADVWSCYEV